MVFKHKTDKWVGLEYTLSPSGTDPELRCNVPVKKTER